MRNARFKCGGRSSMITTNGCKIKYLVTSLGTKYWLWARRKACIHHNHNHQNDRRKGRQADKDTKVAIIDQSKNPEEDDSGDHGEVPRLRQQLAKWHRAWVCGLPPPVFPMDNSDNPPNLRPLSQAQFSISADPLPQHAPGYTPCHLYPGSSTVRAPAPQNKINSYLHPQLLQSL
ncbi:hypothetical protein HAX54_023078 [Datura stramonium]|uniref:Uncharacterized protein n=1 Tax=Datura stramonium TaxID=4076 RepID=A0ABS8UXN6_DATST|nr:hypothetical protein [Datura stramonium]